jgi:hypothetical protein
LACCMVRKIMILSAPPRAIGIDKNHSIHESLAQPRGTSPLDFKQHVRCHGFLHLPPPY